MWLTCFYSLRSNVYAILWKFTRGVYRERNRYSPFWFFFFFYFEYHLKSTGFLLNIIPGTSHWYDFQGVYSSNMNKKLVQNLQFAISFFFFNIYFNRNIHAWCKFKRKSKLRKKKKKMHVYEFWSWSFTKNINSKVMRRKTMWMRTVNLYIAIK